MIQSLYWYCYYSQRVVRALRTGMYTKTNIKIWPMTCHGSARADHASHRQCAHVLQIRPDLWTQIASTTRRQRLNPSTDSESGRKIGLGWSPLIPRDRSAQHPVPAVVASTEISIKIVKFSGAQVQISFKMWSPFLSGTKISRVWFTV